MADTDKLLQGVIDIHIHTNPDIRGRRLNDIELATAGRGWREGAHRMLTCVGKAAQNTPYAAMRQLTGLHRSLCSRAGMGQ